ncbi:MAG: hypothetical protein PEGG_00850 [Paraeggerthella hongkongensis]
MQEARCSAGNRTAQARRGEACVAGWPQNKRIHRGRSLGWIGVAAVVVATAVATCAVVSATDAFTTRHEKPFPVSSSMREERGSTDAVPDRLTNSDPRAAIEIARSALDAAPMTDLVSVFDAATGAARELGNKEAPEVVQAVDAFHEAGYEVGFVVYDFSAQRDMNYNADEAFFCASTMKAPFVAYAVQDEIDLGFASFEDVVIEDVAVEGTGVMAFDDKEEYRLEDVLANAIVHSDNTGYALLRERFSYGNFESWCAAAGVDAWAWEGEWYPYCTPLDLAKLWLNVGSYVAAGQGHASWCAGLLSQTDSSFLRAALGARGTVLSKPGFEINTPQTGAGALNDAGVVLAGDGPYVVAIMSDADYDSDYFADNERLIVDLAAALGAARDKVLVHPTVQEVRS